MRRFLELRKIASGLAVSALLAGCSAGMTTLQSGQASLPAQSAADSKASSAVALRASCWSVLRASRRPLRGGRPTAGYLSDEVGLKGRLEIFISDASNNVILILNSACKQIGELAGASEPQGIAVGKDGTLYVADTPNSDILVYAQPYKGKPKALRDAGQYPAGVAVDYKGNLGVTNIISTSGGNGSVTFYDKSGKQGRTVSNATFARVYFDAFDKRGNLYVDGQNSNGDTIVGEIVGGIAGTSIELLTTTNKIAFPGDLQVNAQDQLAIDDQAGVIDTYHLPPENGSLGTPLFTTPLRGSDPVSFAFTASGKDLWAVDGAAAAADEYAYPQGGSPIRSCGAGNGQPIGIALLPALQP